MLRRICAVIVPLTLVTIAAVRPARAQGQACVVSSVASFAVAALAWTPPEPTATSYIVTELEGLTNVAGINNAGQMIGSDYTSAFLWDEGTIIELGTLGGNESRATAINNAPKVIDWFTKSTPCLASSRFLVTFMLRLKSLRVSRR